MDFWKEAFLALVEPIWHDVILAYFWLIAGVGLLAIAALLVWWGRQPAQLGGPGEMKAYGLAAVSAVCGVVTVWVWARE